MTNRPKDRGRITTKHKRNSNIESLRIISMLMIVLSHYTVHSGINNSSLSLGINRFLLESSTLGNIGVIIFVVITGYYLGRSDKPLQLKKLFNLIFEVLFYSIGIYLILLVLGVINFGWKDALRSIFPISSKSYWFATAYVVLYLFHPYINKLLNNLNRKEHLRLIAIGIFVFSILHTITTGDYYGNQLIQFVLFYTIGDYLGKYPDNKFARKNNRLLLLLTSVIILMTSIILLDLIGQRIPLANAHSTYLFDRTSPIAILFAISLFSCFAYKKEQYNGFINSAAITTFGVYLISDNYLLRKIIWEDILKNKDYTDSNYLLLHMAISVICVYIACSIIDAVRHIVTERCFVKLLPKK